MSQHEEEAKDLLTIVNCSKIYNISKKLLCSKVPYFEGLLASNFKESKESKVDFQFDESSFDLFIKWINDQTELQFEHVVDLYDIADYLMIDELKSACSNFLYDKFTVDNLEAILNQVTDTSKLINTKAINSFINRNFLKIVNLKSFLAFSLSTLEYVLKLDLWIESEYDVFEAIIKWIDHDSTSRKQHLTQLLKLIRWDQLDNNGSSAIRDNKYIKELNIADGEPLVPIKTEKENLRTTKTSLLAIYSNPNDSKNIAIFKFQSESWNLIGTFTEDVTLPTHIFCEDQSFDIFYDSGRRGIRVDWCNKTFRYLDSELINYYRLMLLKANYSKFSTGYSHFYKWKDGTLDGSIHYDSLLESKGKFILLCRENYDLNNTHCCWPAKIRNDFKKFDDHLVQGAVVKNDVYAYSRSYKTKLIRFAKDSGKINDLTLPQRVTTQPAFLYERCGISQGRARCLRGKLYGNYLLASNGSQLALGIKSSKDFFFYDPQITSWSHHPMKYSGDLIGLSSVNWPSSYDYLFNETNEQSDVCKASHLNNLDSSEDLNHEDSVIKDEGTVNNHETNEENWPKRQRLNVNTVVTT